MWLVRATTMEEFRAHFNAALEGAIINDELKRQEKWTAAVAIGSRGFVEAIEQRIRTRRQMEAQQESGTWTLREDYGSLFEGQNAFIGRFWL
jgi:hypothetical protein